MKAGTVDAIHNYYNQGREQSRLSADRGQLELARTQEIISRYLPPPPATILDVGGGAGIYALWLAKQGYTVHLVDIMPLHIEQALQASAHQADFPLASAQVGQAQQLEFTDASAAAVLLLGPLYHLTERSERIQALQEAYRVLKPSGVLFAATISRFASLIDGVQRGFLADDHYAELLEQELIDGQHRNLTEQRGYFTTAFFHHPDEINTEVTEASFTQIETLAIEGLATGMPDFERFWNDPDQREQLLRFLRIVESDPAIVGATGHMLTIGHKG